MRIGELASRTGVSHRALRHYEMQKLIESTRQENGYREYAPAAVERVLWIKELIDCGFSTRQIHGLLAYLQDSEPGSEQFRQCLKQHMEKLSALDSLLELLMDRRQRLFDRLERYTQSDPATKAGTHANNTHLDLELEGLSNGEVAR
ncbi:MerR family transcriptional regulator [Pseudomonas sp. A-B-19]|uniref:MerR family transcriptional regulator n=1 Tax=Pseudomonas sp. A-B-19 TaxID=2832405 RepID=UPI001CBE294E|nr:MerR family transcriptional regulator [Pseudomonas sp. A-B-19]